MKSPLQLVAEEVEREQIKKLCSARMSQIQDAVYKRIQREMHTDRFNEVLAMVIEKHGVKNSVSLLSECIEKVAYDSILNLANKKEEKKE